MPTDKDKKKPITYGDQASQLTQLGSMGEQKVDRQGRPLTGRVKETKLDPIGQAALEGFFKGATKKKK